MSRARVKAPGCDRQAMWTAMRGLGAQQRLVSAPAVRGELAGACPLGRIREYLHALAKAGVLAPVAGDPGVALYQWTRDPGPAAPRVRKDGTLIEGHGTAQDALWRALRVLRQATLGELLAVVRPAVTVTEATATTYLSRLARAGVLGWRDAPGAARVWVLPRSSDTGPLAPRIRRGLRAVEDVNTGRLIGGAPALAPHQEAALRAGLEAMR